MCTCLCYQQKNLTRGWKFAISYEIFDVLQFIKSGILWHISVAFWKIGLYILYLLTVKAHLFRHIWAINFCHFHWYYERKFWENTYYTLNFMEASNFFCGLWFVLLSVWKDVTLINYWWESDMFISLMCDSSTIADSSCHFILLPVSLLLPRIESHFSHFCVLFIADLF